MVGVGRNLRPPGEKWPYTRAHCLRGHVFLWRRREVVCNSAESGLWDMLWPQSKACNRETLLVAEEGLREGEMQQFFSKLNLWCMSDLSLSILQRKPGPGTCVINIQGWPFILQSLAFFWLQSIRLQLMCLWQETCYVAAQHTWKQIPNRTKFFTQPYIFKSTLQ